MCFKRKVLIGVAATAAALLLIAIPRIRSAHEFEIERKLGGGDGRQQRPSVQTGEDRGGQGWLRSENGEYVLVTPRPPAVFSQEEANEAAFGRN